MKKWLCGIILALSIVMLPGCSLLNPNGSSIKTEEDSDERIDTISPEEFEEKETETPTKDGNNDSSNIDNNNNTEQNQPKDTTSSYKIKDYYPFQANNRYIYEGKGNEFAGYTAWVDYIKGEKLQLRITNDGTELSRVIENKDGELKIIFSREECYYREDFTSKTPNKDEILLKEPLVKGTSWTLPEGNKRYISQTDIDVSTPAGNYKTLEVTTEGSDFKTFDYYALNVGLVKSIFQSKDSEVSSSLKEIESGTDFSRDVSFYYPNPTVDKLFLVKETLSFKTNDITKMAFEKNFKTIPNDELIKLIGPKAKIKSMFLHSDGMVYVDFSQELITEMNLGANYESMVLQAITNTIGKYYGVEKVYITVENKPYESGHILMKKGEPFIVNTSNVVEPG